MSKFEVGDMVAVYDEQNGRRVGCILDVLAENRYYVVSKENNDWGYRAHEKQIRHLKKAEKPTYWVRDNYRNPTLAAFYTYKGKNPTRDKAIEKYIEVRILPVKK